MGPPSRICWRNLGTTEPDEPSTLPKRTMLNLVLEPAALECAAKACKAISAKRLLAPITLVGRTALSVLMSTKSLTPFSAAAWAVRSVPNTLFLMPAAGLCSTSGTCL